MQMQMPLLFLKPMDQSRHGVPQILEAQHPLVVAIPKFIQTVAPLLPLKPMAQSRYGVTQTEGSPHAAIEPSVLMTAKACQFE
jgi:hypothetical protein